MCREKAAAKHLSGPFVSKNCIWSPEKLLIRDFRQGRCLLARLEYGKDIIGQISLLAGDEKIETGIFDAIGALSLAELGYYDQASMQYGKILIEEPMELVSCLGNITLKNGHPFVHAHAVLGNKKGKVLGGHLTSGLVFAAELHLVELLGQPLKRDPDSITGLNLWSEE
jgi:predicted DNA-binding protein with PD1-like motif